MPVMLAQAQAAAPLPSTAELVVFVIIGALSLGSAVSMIFMRNAVHAALMLVVNFFTIAVFYAVQEAQFLATVQIIVYAGAIMVLFLFVIMLLGVGREDSLGLPSRVRGQRASGAVLGVVLFAALAIATGGPYLAQSSACPTPPPAEGASAAEGIPCAGLVAANEAGNTQGIGALLFTRYVWPFEITSVLLVIAAIGAMVLGRRDEDPEDLIDVGAVLAGDTPPPGSSPDIDDDGDSGDDVGDDDDVVPASIGQGNPAPSSGPVGEDA